MTKAPPTAQVVTSLNSYEQYLAFLGKVFGSTDTDGCASDGRCITTGGGPWFSGVPDDARNQPENAHPRRYQLAERFRHFDQAPEMLVIPAGSFQMGAHPLDPD